MTHFLLCALKGFGIAAGLVGGLICAFFALVALGEWVEDRWGYDATGVMILTALTFVLGSLITLACAGVLR